MKKISVFILSVTLVTITCLAFSNKKEIVPPASKGFALIELFTSEGCSSCPPAEAVMHKLIQKVEAESLPVYVIEFHVDYWDYLGWKDTFATAGYSQRQQNYGDFLKLNSIYTPQAIVNGKIEILGSDEEQINSKVSNELQSPAAIVINCEAKKAANSKIEVTYTLTRNISGYVLNFAVVESDLTTSIKKGENAHKTLTHDNVARVFKSIHLNSSSGKIMLDVPHVNLSHSKLICYVQNVENMNIIGATGVGIAQ